MERASIVLDFLIEPEDFGDINESIRRQISQRQGEYIAEIGAIFMRYKSHRIVTTDAHLLYNRPQLSLQAKIKCSIMTPRVGIVVPASVVAVSADTVFCLAYHSIGITATVPKARARLTGGATVPKARARLTRGATVNVRITGVANTTAFHGTVLNEI